MSRDILQRDGTRRTGWPGRAKILISTGVAAATSLVAGSAAYAQVSSTVAYSGYLQIVDDESGELVTVDGEYGISFGLYDAEGTLQWAEIHADTEFFACEDYGTCSVDVHNGRFSVDLGTISPIGDTLATGDELYLATSLQVGDEWIQFPTRQRFGLAPHATLTEAATDLAVDTITSATTTDVGGDLDVPSVAVTGDVTIGGALDATSVTTDGAFGSDGTINVTGDVATATVVSVNPSAVDTTAVEFTIDGTRRSLATVGEFFGSGIALIDADDGINLTDADGSVTLNGTVETTNGSLGIITQGGNIEFDDFTLTREYPIHTYIVNVGSNASTTFAVDPDDWHCTIGSMDFGRGDLESGSNRELLQMYLSPNADNYTLHANMDHHNSDPEEKVVGIICFDTSVTEVGAEWGWWE